MALYDATLKNIHNDVYVQGPIPNVPKELIEFLEREEMISTEGIFRRSSSNQQTRDSLAIYNQGKMMGDTLNDPILAAGIYSNLKWSPSMSHKDLDYDS